MKKAHYRNIPIYYDPKTEEVKGRNWFYDILVGINIYIDFNILSLEELPIWVDEEKEEILKK